VLDYSITLLSCQVKQKYKS